MAACSAVNGSLTSAVTVNDSGTLGGSGRIAALTANSGGRVAPGNSIGTLSVAGDVTFAPGSTYAVELSPTSSDRIVAGGTASISGATVSLSLENSPTLLSTTEAQSLLGRQYDILQAAGGIQGQFGAVLPNYLFIGGSLDYAANAIQLDIERNATSFASVGQTPNQRCGGGRRRRPRRGQLGVRKPAAVGLPRLGATGLPAIERRNLPGAGLDADQ